MDEVAAGTRPGVEEDGDRYWVIFAVSSPDGGQQYLEGEGPASRDEVGGVLAHVADRHGVWPSRISAVHLDDLSGMWMARGRGQQWIDLVSVHHPAAIGVRRAVHETRRQLGLDERAGPPLTAHELALRIGADLRATIKLAEFMCGFGPLLNERIEPSMSQDDFEQAARSVHENVTAQIEALSTALASLGAHRSQMRVLGLDGSYVRNVFVAAHDYGRTVEAVHREHAAAWRDALNGDEEGSRRRTPELERLLAEANRNREWLAALLGQCKSELPDLFDAFGVPARLIDRLGEPVEGGFQ